MQACTESSSSIPAPAYATPITHVRLALCQRAREHWSTHERGSGLRQVAKAIRDGAYRLATVAARVAGKPELLPPAHLRLYYYRTLSPARFRRACDDVEHDLKHAGLKPEHRVLDVGSGIGNLAIGLLDYLKGGYDGIELHEEAVAWCQQTITPRHPQFRFHRADVASVAYNRDGGTAATAYRFPFPDRSFDAILLSSVFTHMLPQDVEHYVREIGRLLTPHGVACAGCTMPTCRRPRSRTRTHSSDKSMNGQD